MNQRRRKYELRVRLEGPLDVIVHPAPELEELRGRVARLESDLGRMSLYVQLTLSLTDQLREAKKILDGLGQDTSFIRLRGN